MKEVRAPNVFRHLPRPWIFLAGSIEGGTAERWQHIVVRGFADSHATLLNPRRDDWDATWRAEASEPQFRSQVDWELEAQDRSDLILMYFDPDTRAAVTLLELGLCARSGKALVCCPAGFWRKGNVDLVCRRYGTHQVASLQDLIAAGRERLAALERERA